MNYSAPSILLALVFSAGLLGQSAKGAIIQPVSATSATGNLSDRPIDKTIDGSGLTTGGASILDEIHEGCGSNTGPYFVALNDDAGTAFELTFDLGGAFDVDGVHIWQYDRTGAAGRSFNSFDILFSTDGTNFSNAISLSGWTQGNGDNANDIAVESQSFAVQSGITHIRLANVVNHGDGTYTGLSEIRFNAIPEPSAILLCGLGGLLLLRRRRA